jgi:hypothetical protein
LKKHSKHSISEENSPVAAASLQRSQCNVVQLIPGAIRVPGQGALQHSRSLDDIKDSQQFLNDNFDATHIVETIDEEGIRQRVLQ